MGESTFTVIITDLDGTLLDHRAYDFTAALPALIAIRRRKIPLVLCSSKTAAEIRHQQARLEINHPFIAENGGVLYLPTESQELQKIVLGVPYGKLQRVLTELESSLQMTFRRFDSLNEGELSRLLGLAPDEVRRAQQREFDLPFQIESGQEKLDLLRQEVKRYGLQLTEGGRFLHLTGTSDKGSAVRRLVGWYQTAHGRKVFTIGLGDSLNDLSLLRAVDQPIVIPNPESRAPLRDQILSAIVAPAEGPAGWNAAVLSILEK